VKILLDHQHHIWLTLDQQDPQTRCDPPLNSMNIITTLISNRALKEFNYDDFECVEAIPDVGPNEIKKAYIQSQGRVIIKYIDESDENKYYKKLHKEVSNIISSPKSSIINVYKFYISKSIFHLIFK
jgi:hypothetical protein